MKREDLPPDFPYKETSEYYSHIPEYRPGEVVYFAIHHTLSYYWYVVEILNTYNSSGGVVKVKYLETVQKAGIGDAHRGTFTCHSFWLERIRIGQIILEE